MSLASGEYVEGTPAISQANDAVVLLNTCSNVLPLTGKTRTPDPNENETKPSDEPMFTPEKVSA